MTSEEAWAVLGTWSGGDYAWLTLPGLKVEARRFLATEALAQANVPYGLIGGLAVAAWVRTVDDSADRGTPNVDLTVGTGDVERAIEALSKVFNCRDGLRFGENAKALPRSAVRLWPIERTTLDADALSRAATLEGVPTVALDDLVRAKLALWRRIDKVHLRDLIGNDLVPVGLVDATWLDRLPAPLAARLQELLDDPEG